MPPDGCIGFKPAPELLDWVRLTFLWSLSPLFNPEHDHLNSARLAFLWTDVPNEKHGKRILAQAEIPFLQGHKWAKARQEQQIIDWFGDPPDFLITVNARWAQALDDASFCALIEHELYHCGQAEDGFGIPKFRKNGDPVFMIKGHDVEEFSGVIRRYGITKASSGVEDLVKAALGKPEIAGAEIAAGCGVCS
jgi:hypothetical protein